MGSIVASLVATRTDEELPDLFKIHTLNFNAFDPVGSRMRKIKRFLTKRTSLLHGGNVLICSLNRGVNGHWKIAASIEGKHWRRHFP